MSRRMFVALFSILIFSLPSFACMDGECGPPVPSLDDGLLRDQHTGLAITKAIKDFQGLTEARASNNAAGVDPKCRAAYLRLYSKAEIDMRLAFGYFDVNQKLMDGSMADVALDKFYFQQTISTLTLRCRNDRYFACGFTRDRRDPDLLTKTVIDPLGRSRLVKLRITHSSAATLERHNREFFAAEQRKQTEKSKQNFLDGLRMADVVIYSGHARDGGGPDFTLPVRTRDGKVNYSYYHKNRPGLIEALSALKEREDGGPAFVHLDACDSEKHFYSKFKQVAPNTGFVIANDLVGTDAGAFAVLGSIDALLGQRCEADFRRAIGVKYYDYMRLKDFFR